MAHRPPPLPVASLIVPRTRGRARGRAQPPDLGVTTLRPFTAAFLGICRDFVRVSPALPGLARRPRASPPASPAGADAVLHQHEGIPVRICVLIVCWRCAVRTGGAIRSDA